MDTTAMHKIPYGLYVLTAESGGKQNGCIINTVTQQTSTPLLISVTVNKENYTHDMILKSGKFNISVIDETADFELFKHFGFQSGKDTEKIKGYDSASIAENGISYVTKNVNTLICAKVRKTVDVGTHTIFIAEVADSKKLSDNPTMTYSYYHKNVKPAPEATTTVGYRCKICGYVYNGENLPEDFVCPLCKHGAADFEKI